MCWLLCVVPPPPPELKAMLLISMAFLFFRFYEYAIQYAILFWFPSHELGLFWMQCNILRALFFRITR